MSAEDTAGPSPLPVPDHELIVRASRAGGPGGQHVNTASTRVEVRWNLWRAGGLTEEERQRVATELAGRIDRRGWLRVVASRSRSQHQNREEAIRRLRELVDAALTPRRARRKTRVPAAERRRRLREKRRRAEVKRDRRSVRDDE